jgi:hypothetical protein
MRSRQLATARDPFDDAIVDQADREIRRAIEAFLAIGPGTGAVVVTAPAGAGKTALVCRAVTAARRAGLRLAVATPTNEQAYALVARLAAETPKRRISFLPANSAALPAETARRSNVELVDPEGANAASVVVGTLAKLGDAACRGDLEEFDALIVDEAYQADASRYYAVAGVARAHLLVGDGGQLSPFATIPDADHWRGLPEDPLQTAVGVLLRNHPRTPVFRLPVTRRLDRRALPIARLFYPAIEFGAAVLPGVRALRLDAGRRTDRLDTVLGLATRDGWAYLALPPATTVSADPEIVSAIAGLVERLEQRSGRVRCEHSTRWTRARVAVGVAHNDQKDHVTVALQRAGIGDVLVETANRLQGLELDVVIAWHPLAGLPEADEFHLDPGRLCVLLTRHRHACIVVGRAGDEELVRGVPPRSPSYLGTTSEPMLDGWGVHEGVFASLEKVRVAERRR